MKNPKENKKKQSIKYWRIETSHNWGVGVSVTDDLS